MLILFMYESTLSASFFLPLTYHLACLVVSQTNTEIRRKEYIDSISRNINLRVSKLGQVLIQLADGSYECLSSNERKKITKGQLSKKSEAVKYVDDFILNNVAFVGYYEDGESLSKKDLDKKLLMEIDDFFFLDKFEGRGCREFYGINLYKKNWDQY